MTAAAALLLALHWWLGVSGWFDKTVTSDETAHLVSGYSYWRFNDYRLQPENGNLPQRWGALPLLVLRPHLDPAEQPRPWANSHVWLIGQHFFFESGNDTGFMLAAARGVMALWSVALGILVFAWTRRLWGEVGALIALALLVFSPTMLAHGPLVTSDMTAAFFLLAATAAFWRLLDAPSPGRLAVSTLVTGLAAVAKFSFVILGPVFVVLILLRALLHRLDGGLRAGWWIRTAGHCGLHVVVAFGIIWASFGFRLSGFAPGLPAGLKYFLPWAVVLPIEGPARALLITLKDWAILPEAYLHGFAFVLRAAESRGAFLAGEYSPTGWWWFFPYAFLIKTSLAELAAFALASMLAIRRLLATGDRRFAALLSRLRPVLPLIVLFGVYWAVSVTSNLNIGHRHLLPIYPVLFILTGALVPAGASIRWRLVALTLAVAAAIESQLVRPHYLAFFNRVAGGPANGWRHLADSSLDWGQDLPALAPWLAANRREGEPVYLSYFGMGDPRYEGITAEPLAPYYQHFRPRKWQELKPGLYCIGTTMLQNPYSEWSGDWTARHEGAYRNLLTEMRSEIASGERSPGIVDFGEDENHPLWVLDRLRFARLCLYLRRRAADASINHTIRVYRLSHEEIRIVVDGTPAELADLIAAAMPNSS